VKCCYYYCVAIRNEIQEVNLGIYDQSHDAVTREITDKLASSGYFVMVKELPLHKRN
jgi:ABC-2 type transport system permease protein